MKKIASLVVLTMLVISLCGCSAILDRITDAANTSSVQMKSDDGKYSLTIPGDWEDAEDTLNDAACLSVSDEATEQYVILISENKQDFAEEYTAAEFFEVIKSNMTASVTDAQWTTETTATANGFPAISAEFNGVVDNMKIHYFVKVIITESSYNQLVGWTLQSKTDQNRETIIAVMDTFEEIA